MQKKKKLRSLHPLVSRHPRCLVDFVQHFGGCLFDNVAKGQSFFWGGEQNPFFLVAKSFWRDYLDSLSLKNIFWAWSMFCKLFKALILIFFKGFRTSTTNVLFSHKILWHFLSSSHTWSIRCIPARPALRSTQTKRLDGQPTNHKGMPRHIYTFVCRSTHFSQRNPSLMFTHNASFRTVFWLSYQLASWRIVFHIYLLK